MIPEPADQIGHRKKRGSRGGRPVDFDVEDYKGRNVVERAFNKLKNWRGLATRYDKHALTYRGGMVLASIVLWLQACGRVNLNWPQDDGLIWPHLERARG